MGYACARRERLPPSLHKLQMTDSTQPPDDRAVFARFLATLDSDPDEAGRRYLRLHRKLVGLFSMNGISDPMAAADEAIRRAGHKLCAGAEVSELENFCKGIARNIVKELLRAQRREAKAFLKFIDDSDNATGEQVERIDRVLKPCFAELPEADQTLLRDYCRIPHGRARAEYRRQLAERMNITMLALRLRVTRLRRRLTGCVKKRAKQN